METQPLLSIGARTFLQACEEAAARARENGPEVADVQRGPVTPVVGPSGSTEYGLGMEEDEREPATPVVGP